ncbi:MAG: hypothetical protein DWQ01_20275 [Planctomycetota bacterium]|nr:MAG: hypothetical protein DWQ01_20275 [Planctomycetota bacterium]
MSDSQSEVKDSAGPPKEDQFEFDYDRGGVPGFLVLVYVAFLTFVLFYVLDYLIPSWWSLEWHINP